MRIVITGSNGLVGRRLVAQLSTQGHSVLGLSRGPRRVEGPFEYASVELGDTHTLTTAVERFRPEGIVNCGGMTDVDGCERAPVAAYEANVGAVATLCKVSLSTSAHLVQVSTDYVFDGEGTDRASYDVDAVPNPKGVYALTKHAAEQTIRALLPSDQWAIARTAVVSGWPSTGKNNFGYWVISTLEKGQSATLFRDQWVSMSHATNVAGMLAELVLKRHSGVWHTCGAEVTDRASFGRRVCERFGFDPALILPTAMANVQLKSPRPKNSGLSVAKTMQTLEAKPWTVQQILNELWREKSELATKGESA
jgi:dTDP-4-dehydrorhamnose reductase